MNFPYKIADELLPVLEQYNSRPGSSPGPPLQEIFRAAMIASAARNKIQSDTVVRVRDEYFVSPEAEKIQLPIYSPEIAVDPLPCLYWMHSDGTISGLPEQNDHAMHVFDSLVPRFQATIDFLSARVDALKSACSG